MEDEIKSEKLKCEFSQVEEDLDLQESTNQIPIPNKKKTPKKKTIIMKDKKKEKRS